MTRIYTNVPAMIARANLGKNMSALQTSLERLSTGFKINSGKDDPAGLIASEMLRSDITGIKMAIRNTERANMMIATADSALNEVTNLLNDIRGLITEAASTGTMSHEMIYANQLQVDASLDAIDRIAAQTTFMGQKLLDGSLDFNLVGIDRNNLKGLAVHQAAFGANKGALEVAITVREAAEKAALYYNQPALAESIILRWGGNYGFDMETFEKGATVAEIAEIINRRADGTGVYAEVGSDALKGLLYVSSLGPDNDIIIEAGLAGLNEGNVQVKYLPGSSEGIQVRYEEPLYPGAPANILVYLQTEAYQAAFADDVDTTWEMRNGKLVPVRDNNALLFTANIEGAQYNNANIYYVNGLLTDPRFLSADNPTGTPGMPYAYYSEAGQSSSALFGNVPGVGSGGVNNTSSAFNLGIDEYFAIQSRATSSAYNNVEVRFVAVANTTDPLLGGRAARADYDENFKTLSIYYNNDGNTTLRDVQDALSLLNNNTGHGFEVRPQIGTKTLSDVRLSGTTAMPVSSNTHNSGGVAGSLFIVMPPDGMMPAKPDYQERPGVTALPISDGFHLAYNNPGWDNHTFEFRKSGVVDDAVAITYTAHPDTGARTVAVTVGDLATYEDILAALNDPLHTGWQVIDRPDGNLYWSDAAGRPITPDVPVGLVNQTGAGITGLSTTHVAALVSGNVFLRHNNVILDNLSIEFNLTDVPLAQPAVAALNANGQLVVSYNEDANFNHILAALNLYANTTYSLIGPDLDPFTWVDEQGTDLSVTIGTITASSTTMRPVNSGTVQTRTTTLVSDRYYLAHNNETWDQYTFVFNKVDTYGGDVSVVLNGNEIIITLDNGTTYESILRALNENIPPWTESNGVTPAWPFANPVGGFGPPPTTPTDLATYGGLWWVDAANIPIIPGVPQTMVASTGVNNYQPHWYSADARSMHVGDGFYLQHTHGWWDNRDVRFVAADDATPNHLSVSLDGSTGTVTVTVGRNVSYDDILNALNHPGGTATPAFAGWDYTNGGVAPPAAAQGELRWVNVGGETHPATTLVAAGAAGTADLSIKHTDPKWDNYRIEFVAAPVTVTTTSVETTGDKSIRVTVGHGATIDEVLASLNGSWTGKPAGMGILEWEFGAGTPPTTVAFPTNLTLGRASFRGGTVEHPTNTSANRPTAPLHHTITMGALTRAITANDIAAIFDLDSYMSRGSERAASLFTVKPTIDNDGTGAIRLENYWINRHTGEFFAYQSERFSDMTEAEVYELGYTLVHTKTAFEKAFGGGVTGGAVMTTAADLVTALNNSAFWGMIMCPEMLAELAAENAEGKYYDAGNRTPVITARLAPGNNGYFAVSTFQEVAYYGNPNEGTALQFLGQLNAPNIRFVVDGPNSDLYLERTSVPAVIGRAQAILTAQDSGASLTITANKEGGEYDDVQFVFKRVGEDARGVLAPDRRDGWVEYDEGVSHAYAHAIFRDANTNQPVADSAFYITATERGDMFNNVDIAMRLDEAQSEKVVVRFDAITGQLRISIASTAVNEVTTNDIIAAINDANVGFKAELSYAENPINNGTGTFNNIGLSANWFTSIANTEETGGHTGGTVTVWLADANAGPGGPAVPGTYSNPTQEDIVRLINNDAVVSKMFTARAYNTVQGSDGKVIDFVKDGPILSNGGLIEPALITVHLATDKAGNVITTAADLEKWWNNLDPALVDNISVSLVRPAGAVWDDCDDPFGNGFLKPTIAKGDCDEWIINDIMFVGWNDQAEQQNYVAKYSNGVMTSQRGIDSSYQLFAKNLGPEWDGFTIEYVQDNSLTGRFADNFVDGSDMNPCDDNPYSGLWRDDCGNLITPDSTTEKGLRLVYDEASKKISVYVNFGVTTANDIQQLINSDPRTRNLFQVTQLGNGTGLIHQDDDTLITKGGAAPPGELNGAKLLFGSNATDYYLIFKSMDYGSDQFVHVQADPVDPNGETTFTVTDSNGKVSERANGQDVDALINGIRAVGNGLDISLNTSALSMTYTFSERAGTTPGYATEFTIAGGGATFQVGPDVVSRQQITMGIRSINTVQLGGVSGVLNQIRSGQDANLFDDPGKAFRIVEESLLAITSIRGRLGTMQRATLETNINVLNDTLTALTEAESQIRDTDFAEETSNLTRAQILVQANMNTLGIANQIPNYMLSLLGR